MTTSFEDIIMCQKCDALLTFGELTSNECPFCKGAVMGQQDGQQQGECYVEAGDGC